MILMIDNYDSFTYNLVQYLRELGETVQVFRNDAITLDEIRSLHPDRIVISPGPCTPTEAGISMPVIREFAGQIPILGVCLGHQAIGQAFGGRIIRAKQVMHGKLSAVHHLNRGVFKGLPNPLTVTRYHSLVIDATQVPDDFEVTAWTVDAVGQREEIMGIRHRTLAIEGVQFHPESIMSEAGHELLGNFCKGVSQ